MLDAWVAEHIEKARANFAALPTVRDRAVHLLLPVEFERDQGQPTAAGDLTAAELRPLFSRDRGCVLIQGEGGAGKTSWACRLGWWAVAEPDLRLAPHAMLPVIVEEEISSPDPGIGPLLNHIRGKLEALAGLARPISDRLLEALLRSGRILVIIDHFSELNQTTRDRLRPGDPGFPIASLVVTARTNELLGNQPRWVLRPCRIEADKLYKFLTDYLRAKGREQAFPTQADFFEACRRLSNLVGRRDITPLLARMFADLMIAANADNWDDLPRTIPDLIAGYVSHLNRSITEASATDEQVRPDLQRVAWACVQADFRPGEADRSTVLRELGGAGAAERLRYLEQRLQLVRSVAHGAKVRLTLDPIAEYLAAGELVTRNGSRSASWERFFGQVAETPGAPLGIRGFLTAVRDVCRSRGSQSDVLEGVAQRIRGLLGDNTAEVDEEVQELIDALKSRSPYLRQVALQSLAQDHPPAATAPAVPAIIACLRDNSTQSDAVDAIKAIGPAASEAVPHLISILERSAVWIDQCSAADALGAIGPAAKAAIPALRQALEHEERPVVRDAVVALGLIDPTAPETIQALRRVATESGQVGLPVAFALAKAGDDVPSRLDSLIRAAEGDDLGRCQWAANFLGHLGPIAASVGPRLGAVLEREESTFAKGPHEFVTISKVRDSVAVALVKIGVALPPTVPHLIQLFNRGDEAIGQKALELVIAMGRVVVPDLCRGLTDLHWRVRYLSAHGLGELAEQTVMKAEAVEALINALTSDTDEDVRWNAAEALGKFGPAATTAIPTLETALRDEAEKVRKEAATVLERLRS